MPLYEYEHLFDECELCDFRFAVIQDVKEEPLSYCPSCGLEVKRIVSIASINTRTALTAGRAAKAGFTTWKKSGDGAWEKVDGPGVDVIQGSEADKQALQEEAKSAKAVDLDC